MRGRILPKFTSDSKKNWLNIFLAITIILGVFFRLTHLGYQLYWHDEAYTIFRASGYTAKEINQQLFDGQIYSLKDVLQYQYLNSETTWLDTVKSLAFEDAQHPPIYYLLVRFWMSVFGQSISVIRSLSALASLLTFALLFLLSKLIFRSSFIAWITTTLFAASPLQVMYAQEAREYALWSLTVVFSTIAFVLALQRNKIINWAIYTITLIISIYTFSLSVLIILFYIFYVLIKEDYRLTKQLIYCLTASLLAMATFLPWLFLAMKSWSETGAVWSSIPIPLNALLKTWGLHLVRLFILSFKYFNISENFNFYTLLSFFILILCLAIISFSFYEIISRLPKYKWLLPIILTASTFLPLTSLDLILGGQRSTATRYLMPTFLGIQLVVSFALAVNFFNKNNFKRKIVQSIYVIIITAGIFSCVLNFQSPTAWTKGISYNLYQVAELINEQPNTLIISSSKGINFGNILALTYLVKKDTSFLLVDGWQKKDYETEINIPSTYKNIFILGLSEQLQKKLEQKYNIQIKLAFSDNHLWLGQIKR